MDWDGTYIVDDDLKNIFSKLPAGVHLEMLLDSCHSGTGTREAALACLPTEYAIKQRFLIPPVDILCRQADEDDLKLQKIGRADNPQNHVLFAGCKDTQKSADAYISGKEEKASGMKIIVSPFLWFLFLHGTGLFLLLRWSSIKRSRALIRLLLVLVFLLAIISTPLVGNFLKNTLAIHPHRKQHYPASRHFYVGVCRIRKLDPCFRLKSSRNGILPSLP